MIKMAGFVPKEKLSKKARNELNRQRRRMWDFRPVTKVIQSRKLYNRKKNARDRNDDYGTGVLPYAAFCCDARNPSNICSQYCFVVFA